MNKIIILYAVVSAVLLGGCWDEEQYKDITIVPLLGLEGDPNDVTATFAFPVFEQETISYEQTEGKGHSVRDARDDANHKAAEGLDLSQLEVLLITDETAKTDLYQYLDMFYRTPRNRLSSSLAIVKGEMEQYFNPPGKLEMEVSRYYSELIRTAHMYTTVPKMTLQKACTLLFQEDRDLSLPYIEIDKESGIPAVVGVALFSKRVFTGEHLTVEEAMIANLMRKEIEKYARITYTWKENQKESPLTMDVLKIKRKLSIGDEKISVTYKMKVNIEEFPDDRLYKNLKVEKLETFLSEEMTNDFNKVIEKTQNAKSDIVGFGRYVHAFHPKLWDEEDWQETYSTLPINVKVKVEILRTGIMD